MHIDISQERLNAWKRAFAKSGINYETDDEYKEAIFNLVGYFEILIDMDKSQKEAADKIKKDNIKEVG